MHITPATNGKLNRNGRWTEFCLGNKRKVHINNQIDWHKRVFIPRKIAELRRRGLDEEEILLKLYPYTFQARNITDLL